MSAFINAPVCVGPDGRLTKTSAKRLKGTLFIQMSSRRSERLKLKAAAAAAAAAALSSSSSSSSY